MSDRDDLDPADWLAQQFGAAEPEPAAAPAEPVVPVAPVAEPVVAPETVALPQPFELPAPAASAPPAPADAPAAATAGGFQWGLTPGAEPVEVSAAAQPVTPPPVDVPPAEVPPVDVPTQAMPVAGHDLETVAFDSARWLAAPVDSSLDGVTEVIEAEIVGLAVPEGEGAPASAIDSLFGDTQFQEYQDTLVSGPPPRDPSVTPPAGPRSPMPRVQKVLLWVAGGLLAALALVALFLVGTKLPATMGAAPAVTASPTPTPTSTVVPVGPIEPGEHQWDALLGGECLTPWQSAWQDTYVVVDCATPHAAQMVFRGLFDDAATVAYPGVEELQKRINLLCTPPTVIDYSKAGAFNDIQVTASFAASAEDWNEGNRTYFCFVNRSSGQDLTGSVAVPQVVAPLAG